MNFGVSRENGEVLLARLDDLGRVIEVERLSRQEAVTLAVNLIGQATETMPEPPGNEVVPARPDGERFKILELGDPPPKPLKSAAQLAVEKVLEGYEVHANPLLTSADLLFLLPPRQTADNPKR